MADRRKKYSYNERYFDSIDTEGKAYFFGLLAADGSIKMQDNLPRAVVLELKSNDIFIIEKLRNALGDTRVPVKIRPAASKSCEKAKVAFFSGKMAMALLEKYGRDKTHNLGNLSEYIPKELNRHFIRGVLDGDGHWRDEEYRLRFGFRGTDVFLEFLQEIIPFKSIISGKKWKSLVSTRHADAINFGKWIYSDTELYMPRKYNTFISGLNRRRSRKTPNISENPVEGNAEG